MQYTFQTPETTSLYVEVGSGSVTTHATDTTETEVVVEGKDADQVTVEQRGNQVVVTAPQRRAGFFGFGTDLDVTVTLPLDSDLVTRLGSADLTATGRYGSVHVKSGSGQVEIDDVTSDTVIQSGSGDVRIDSALGDLRVKTGSGSVDVGRVAGTTVIACGSGDITVGAAEDEIVTKSGSGDVRIVSTTEGASMSSGSGDLEVGSVRRGVVKAKSASGSVLVGVPRGVPVWTDISSVSGTIRSDLEGAGKPADDQDHVELRLTTVSGDVVLSQI